MKKIKYFYNTYTLRYEKLITPLRVKLLRVFGFVAAAVVTAFIIVAIALLRSCVLNDESKPKTSVSSAFVTNNYLNYFKASSYFSFGN